MEHCILVMDDNKYVGDVLQEMLQLLNYDVKRSKCGDATFNRYLKKPEHGTSYDLIFLELSYGYDSKEAVRMLQPIDPEVKVVLCSAFCSVNILDYYKTCGISSILVKPFMIDDVKTVLQELL
jgi:CheY-like chemotaxis protein